MAILITGGAGFIGSNFIDYLLKKHQHIKIVNLDNLTYAGELSNLKEVANINRHIFVKGDICNTRLSLPCNTLASLRSLRSMNFLSLTHIPRSLRS